MERTKTGILPEQLISWKKTGNGALRLKNLRYIKPGEIFEAYPSQIPAAFRDTVIPLNPAKLKEEEQQREEVINKVAVESSAYTVKPRGVGGWVDVIDINGKVINEKAMKLPAAEELIKKLQG
jgi:hypothetical protein